MSLTMSSDIDGQRAGGPVDAPRLVRQRRVNRGWVGLGLLAIVVAALGSVTLVRALGPAHEYLAVARDVPVGAEISANDLATVRLSNSPGLTPVPAYQMDEVVGLVAAVPLSPGTLLSPQHLTADRVPAPGEQLVAVSMPQDQLPGRAVRAGDPVMLVATTGNTVGASSLDTPRTFTARVHHVGEGTGRNNVVVSVIVDEGDGAAVAALAAAGRIAIVLLAGGD